MSEPTDAQLPAVDERTKTVDLGEIDSSDSSFRSSPNLSKPLSPIGRLPFELLSHIFELCGHEDWMDALRISRVSQNWREIVFATPSAWCFLILYTGGRNPLERYLPYSHLAAQRPFHISFSGSVWPVTALSSVMNNLHCLHFTVFPDNLSGLTFPNLNRLIVTNTTWLSMITAAQFPKLRHLLCDSWVRGGSNSFPPLETFAFTMRKDLSWLQSLQACARTLVSLKINGFSGDHLPLNREIMLPWLRCLHVSGWDAQQWMLHFKTPRLETYIETRTAQSGHPLIHENLKNITCVRFDHTLPILPLPRLRLLQLITPEEHVLKRMVEACCNNGTFPALSQVEVQFTTLPDGYKALQFMQEMSLIPISV